MMIMLFLQNGATPFLFLFLFNFFFLKYTFLVKIPFSFLIISSFIDKNMDCRKIWLTSLHQTRSNKQDSHRVHFLNQMYIAKNPQIHNCYLGSRSHFIIVQKFSKEKVECPVAKFQPC